MVIGTDTLSATSASKSRYWVCVITKNGAKTVGRTLDSIMKQTVPPELVVVVDDGSIDETRQIIGSRSQDNFIRLHLITLPDRGYDIRRVSSNINRAYSHVAEKELSFDYSMISGDDCIYPPNYSEFLLSRMEHDQELVIASGDWGIPPPPDMIKAPQGSGRFIREDFWKRVGGRYPTAYGWEAWLLFKALELGYKIANFTELRYIHLRPSGSAHKFKHWGIAMRTLGYHPLLVLLRLAKNLFGGPESIPLRGNLSMAEYYFLPQIYRNDPYFQYFDKPLRDFVRKQQLQRILRNVPRFQGLAFALWKVLERVSFAS